jgi:hypothetical protein
MRLVALLRFRRRFSMQSDPTRNISLKRSFSQQATASVALKPHEEYPSKSKYLKLDEVPSTPSPSGISSRQEARSPPPIPKMPSSSMSRIPKNALARIPRSASSTTSFRFPSRGRGNVISSTPSNATVLELPVRDHDFIVWDHQSKSQHLPPIKPVYEENPKSPLSNFFANNLGTVPEYHSVLGVYPGKAHQIWR